MTRQKFRGANHVKNRGEVQYFARCSEKLSFEMIFQKSETSRLMFFTNKPRLATEKTKGGDSMDKRAKLLADRIHSVFGSDDDDCLDCRYTVVSATRYDLCSGHTVCGSYGVAGVVVVVTALLEVGLDPEAVEREVQRQEPHFHMEMWKDESFGCCFGVGRFLKIATSLLG